jgi:hypothetical protein
MLRDEILKLNKNAIVVQNAIDFSQPQFQKFLPSFESKDVRFGWLGSPAHLHDIETLKDSMRLFHNKLTQGSFSAIGAHKNNQQIWLQFAYILSNAGKAKKDRFKIIEGLPVTKYMSLYNEIDCSVIPLEDNYFNRMKSELKVLEAAASGRAVIVKNIHPYTRITKLKPDLFYLAGDDNMDFFRQMKKILKNPLQAKKKALGLQQIVRERYNITQANEIRKQIINRL